MAINQNHLFEELNGVKCAIVEKNVSAERTEFLKSLLEFNQFTVIVVPTPVAPAKPAPVPKPAPAPAPPPGADAPSADAMPKPPAETVPAPTPASPVQNPASDAAGSITPATPAAAVIAAAEEAPTPPPPPPPPATFTVGVTDVMFNPTNAIFGRLLRTPAGHVVTLAYWQQKDEHSRDDVPYFQ